MQTKEEGGQTVDFALLCFYSPLDPGLDVAVLPGTDEQTLIPGRKLNIPHPVRSMWPFDARVQLPLATSALPSPDLERNFYPKVIKWIVSYVQGGHPFSICADGDYIDLRRGERLLIGT